MKQDKHDSFDLIVFGQITRDVLHARGKRVERVGGVSYAASAATRLGLRVGLLASLCDPEGDLIKAELEQRHIDIAGVNATDASPLIYEIHNADEVIDQCTFRLGPQPSELQFPTSVPKSYLRAKAALLYPVWMPSTLAVARILKESGTIIAVDLQHDVSSLDEASDLLSVADYVFTNHSSLLELTQQEDIAGAVAKIHASHSSTLIIKMGICGSLVCPANESAIQIPAFLCDFQLTVGAGDAYDAAFIATLLGHVDIQKAGLKAARVAADVIESTERDPSVAITERTDSRDAVFLSSEDAQKVQIYIAGHFHSMPLCLFIEQIAKAIEKLGVKTFVPHRDVGTVGVDGLTPFQAYKADVQGLQESQILIALLDGASRGGTFVEIGMAIERGIPIYAIRTDETVAISNMVYNSVEQIVGSIAELINPLMRDVASYTDMI